MSLPFLAEVLCVLLSEVGRTWCSWLMGTSREALGLLLVGIIDSSLGRGCPCVLRSMRWVTSRLGYCTWLYRGGKLHALERLYQAQSSAAFLLSNTGPCERITLVLALRRLPSEYSTQVKISVEAHLRDCLSLQHSHPPCYLCSPGTVMLPANRGGW